MAGIQMFARNRMLPWIITGVLAVVLLLVVQTGTAQKAQKQQSTMKEVLTGYVGEKTNLGTIKKVAGDYIVIEDDNITEMVPLNAIQVVRQIKREGEEPPKVEIKLVAKD
jgi:hypothetical protein